jgi:hypothetical protein
MREGNRVFRGGDEMLESVVTQAASPHWRGAEIISLILLSPEE